MSELNDRNDHLVDMVIVDDPIRHPMKAWERRHYRRVLMRWWTQVKEQRG